MYKIIVKIICVSFLINSVNIAAADISHNLALGNDFTYYGNGGKYSVHYTTFADEAEYNTSTSPNKFIYYSSNPDGTTSPIYYDFSWDTNKNIIYGDNTITYQYFKWKTDSDGKKTLINSTDADYDVKAGYIPSNGDGLSSNHPFANGYGDPIVDVAHSFIGIGSDETPYDGNILATSYAINDVYGDFIGNHSTANTFYNRSTIQDITGDFIGNSAVGKNIIYNFSGNISDIYGDFISNTANSIIYSTYRSSIGNIYGDFIGNNAIAISNGAGLNIESVSGDFIDNNQGISNSGTIKSINSSFIGNSYTNVGAAIYNIGDIPSLSGDFINNNANFTSSRYSFGGAISNSGNLTITDSLFLNNAINGPSAGGSLSGGAISTSGNSITDINNSIFINNFAASSGGAIAYRLVSNSHSINNSLFDGNISGGSGALSISKSSGSSLDEYITISNSTFINNSAIGNLTQSAGAVSISGSMTFSDVVFLNNSAISNASGLHAGAIFKQVSDNVNIIAENSNVIFSGNYTEVNGVTSFTAIRGGPITFASLNNNLFIFDDIISDGSFNIKSGNFIMNNIFNGSSTVSLEGGNLNIADGAVQAHTDMIWQMNFLGGTISLDMDPANNIIDNINTSSHVTGTVIFSGLNIISDTSSSTTLKIFTSFGIPDDISDFVAYTNNNRYDVTGSIDNTSIILTPTAISNAFDVAKSSSGVRSFSLTSDYTLTSNGSSSDEFNIFGNLKDARNIDASGNLIIDINNAANGTEVYEFDGNNLYNLVLSASGEVNLNRIVMKNGISTGSGGGAGNNAILTVYGSSFYNNTASTNGGAIVNTGAKLNISNSSFLKNTANNLGGAISSEANNLILTHSVVQGNKVLSGSGGGVATNATSMIEFTEFTGNIASESGGAVYAYNSGTNADTMIEYAEFNNNNASKLGGAVYNEGDMNMHYSELSDNRITGSGSDEVGGGALYNKTGGDVDVYYTTFTNNETFGADINSGGAILNEGNITIKRGTFVGNNASGNNASGGAIKNNASGNVSTVEGSFKNNYASSTGVSDVYGGAIYNQGQITSINSSFEGNYATGESDAYGGAIATQNSIKISGDFNNNYASGDNAYGGAIYGSSLIIDDAKFSSNSAKITAILTGIAQGGAIYTQTDTNISNSTFIGNNTTGSSKGSLGGAIYVNNTATVTDTNFFDNYARGATSDGGAIYTNNSLEIIAKHDDVYFSGNYTTTGILNEFNAIHIADGASLNLSTLNGKNVIFNDGISSSNINNSIIIDGNIVFNDTVSNSSITLNTGEIFIKRANGYNESGYSGIGANELSSSSDSIFNNVNLSAKSGTSLNFMNNSVDNTEFNTLTLDGDINMSLDADLASGKIDTITANRASGGNSIIIDTINIYTDIAGSGGLNLEISNIFEISNIIDASDIELVHGEGVEKYYTVESYNPSSGIISISRLNLVQTIALDLDNKIYNLDVPEVIESNLGTLVGTTLDVTGESTFELDGNGHGGVTILSGQTFTMTDVANVKDFTSDNGGLYNNAGSIESLNTTYTNNSANQNGGVLANTGTATLTNSQHINNNATINGGAIYSNSTTDIKGSTFTGNNAGGDGGAVYNDTDSTLTVMSYNNAGTIVRTEFNNNNTAGDGGAIYNKNSVNDTSIDADFTGNYAEKGGAIYNNGTVTELKGSFTDNYAISTGNDAKGGAVYNSSGATLNINADEDDTIFSGNYTSNNGTINSNAIHNEGTVNINSSNDNSVISYDGFDGVGNYNLQSGVLKLLGSNANFTNVSNLNIYNSSKISLIDNTYNTINLGNTTLHSDLNIGMDFGWTNINVDKIIGNFTTNGNTIYIEDFNIAAKPTSVPVIVNITTDTNIMGSIALSPDINVVTSSYLSDISGGALMYYDNTNGNLNFEIADINGAFTFDVPDKAFIMKDNETATEDLGQLFGNNLSISAGNLNINGGGFGGGIVDSNQAVTIHDVNTFENFTGYAISNDGTTTLSAKNNSSTYNADAEILNTGTLNLNTNNNNTLTINNNIHGDANDIGTINVNGNVFLNSTIENNNIAINNGTLNVSATTNIANASLIGGGGKLNFVNNIIKTYTFNSINLEANNFNMSIDVNLDTLEADKIEATTVTGNNTIYVDEIFIRSDANTIESKINIAGANLKDKISFDGVDVNVFAGSAEDYENGYLIGYSSDTGNLSFEYANLETAFASSVSTKIYSMIENDEAVTGPVVISGDSLSIDGNGFSLNSSDIDISDKELSLTNINVNSEITATDGTVNLANKTTMNEAITGSGTINTNGEVIINSDMSGFTGTTNINGGILSVTENGAFFSNNVNISNNPTLNFINGVLNTYDAKNWTMASNANIAIDVDLNLEVADSIINFTSTTNAINISDIYIIGEKTGETKISVIDGEVGPTNITIDKTLLEISSPMYEYIYEIDDTSLASDGVLIFNGERAGFSPEALEPLVANQTYYLSNLSVYNELFADVGLGDLPDFGGMSSGDNASSISNVWIKSFGRSEDVDLNNSSAIDNVTYGTLIGIDSPTSCYTDNSKIYSTLYVGYVGSRQSYEGVEISQNAATLGAKHSYNNENLFFSATANVGINHVNTEDQFGDDDYYMYSIGTSGKIGYNKYIRDDLILQPNIMASYLFTDAPEFTNTSGISVEDNYVHMLQISPEIKFIYAANKSFNIYGSAMYSWNMISGSNATADSIILPLVSVDPYAEFKIGIQGAFKNGLNSYIELLTTTGGRQGFGGKFGIQWKY